MTGAPAVSAGGTRAPLGSAPGGRSLAVIYNPRAGAGRAARRLAGVVAELERLSLAHTVHPTASLGHAAELASAAALAGEVAVAFGGDGLIGAVAHALRATDGVLGVLPGGRGNDFARALGLPLDPVAACSVLVAGAIAELDLGTVGERTFVGVASCGLDSEANRIANRTRLVRGRLVYAYAALRALARWREATFVVSADGGPPQRVSGYTVAVANCSCYGGGMRIAPSARPDDGLLDIVIVGRTPRLRFLVLLPTVFRGAHVGLGFVQGLRARSVRIEASRPLALYADGDPIAELPATVSVAPAAVRVIVPGGAAR